MTAAETWEAFLEAHFPGYLLPQSAVRELRVEQAAAFLEQLTGRPHELSLLRAVSTLAPHAPDVARFATDELPSLVRRLDARTVTESLRSEGAFRGRLDVRRTSMLWSQGRRGSFVSQIPRRDFDRPENVLVRATVERLLSVVTDLRQAGVLAQTPWARALTDAEGALRHAARSTVLREVSSAAPRHREEQAALAAAHRAYRSAAALWNLLRVGLDDADPERVARIVAEGALVPMPAATRFEVAVLVRLAQAIELQLDTHAPGRWVRHRTLVSSRRREVFDFARDDGAHLRIFYNQAELDGGPTDAAVVHYLGSGGRLRPDITVVTELGGRRVRATVLEAKLSDQLPYLADGLGQATLYRWEYRSMLTGWPKAILVASDHVSGAPRRTDDVVASGWNRWVPAEVVDGMLAEVL